MIGEGRIGNEVEQSHFGVDHLLNVKEEEAEEKKKGKEKLGDRRQENTQKEKDVFIGLMGTITFCKDEVVWASGRIFIMQ